jgi:hypothetical protein
MLKQPLLQRKLSICLQTDNGDIFKDISQQVSLGESMTISNQHCEGQLTIRIKGFSSDPHSLDYFNGRQRLYSIQWNGRLLTELSGDQLVLAADFTQPPRLPPGFRLIEQFTKLIDPGLDLSNLNNSLKPAVCSPLLCAANWMNIQALINNASSLPSVDNMDDCDEKQQRKRRTLFTSRAEREQFRYKTGAVYAFDWFSPYVDWMTFDLHMGLRINTLRLLRNQPVQLSLRSRDSSIKLFSIKLEIS